MTDDASLYAGPGKEFEVAPDADTVGKVVGSKIEVVLADGLPLGATKFSQSCTRRATWCSVS
jgi:hypothetical protein